MRLATATLITALLLLARTASANECNAYVPHTSIADVPLGCSLSVVVPPSSATTYQPHVVTKRFDPHTGQSMTIDVTGAITRAPDVNVDVETYRYDGTCDLHDDGPVPTPFARFDVALQGAEVGDVLDAGTFDGVAIKVVAAGPCPAFAAPALACADPIQSCADGGIDPVPATHGGCSTGGNGGLGAGLALLALRRRTRTRR